MNYEKIDVKTWKRGKLFSHYIDNLRNVLSMTVDIDVTNALKFAHERAMKFYPVMIWAVSTTVNRFEEFRYAFDPNGDLIRWDFVSPYYADFHKEDEQLVLLFTEYSENLKDFHDAFMADRKKYADLRGFELKDVPPNVFNVSCLPWIKYRSFDIHVFDEGKYIAPVITWGKYEEKDKKYLMPLSVQIHHAVSDGYHLSRFFNALQQLIYGLKQGAF